MDCGLQGRNAARSNLISGYGRFLLSEDEAAGAGSASVISAILATLLVIHFGFNAVI